MFTERLICQTGSAMDETAGHSSLQEMDMDKGFAFSSLGSKDSKDKCFPSDRKLSSPDRGDRAVFDKVSTQRKSTRISQGGRVLRNQRYRRMFDESRHTKRLFTPEIKKYLKDWLIRRRDHPYPNRDEKKSLAIQTGLTYIQMTFGLQCDNELVRIRLWHMHGVECLILRWEHHNPSSLTDIFMICNWFANWRRKLKNAGSEDQRTWSHLIKSYNTQAEGNVEHFSICSDDSIWDGKELIDSGDLEDDESDDATLPAEMTVSTAMDHCYSVMNHGIDGIKSIVNSNGEVLNSKDDSAILGATEAQCFTVSSTTTEDEELHLTRRKQKATSHFPGFLRKQKDNSGKSRRYYKNNNIMETNGNNVQFSSLETEMKSKSISLLKRKYQAEKGDAESERKLEPNCDNGDPFTKTALDMSKKSKISQPKLLTKWKESAANFQPTTSYVPWTKAKKKVWPKKSQSNESPEGPSTPTPQMSKEYWAAQGHHREELDAAEALTHLAGFR